MRTSQFAGGRLSRFSVVADGALPVDGNFTAQAPARDDSAHGVLGSGLASKSAPLKTEDSARLKDDSAHGRHMADSDMKLQDAAAEKLADSV